MNELEPDPQIVLLRELVAGVRELRMVVERLAGRVDEGWSLEFETTPAAPVSARRTPRRAG